MPTKTSVGTFCPGLVAQEYFVAGSDLPIEEPKADHSDVPFAQPSHVPFAHPLANGGAPQSCSNSLILATILLSRLTSRSFLLPITLRAILVNIEADFC